MALHAISNDAAISYKSDYKAANSLDSAVEQKAKGPVGSWRTVFSELELTPLTRSSSL